MQAGLSGPAPTQRRPTMFFSSLLRTERNTAQQASRAKPGDSALRSSRSTTTACRARCWSPASKRAGTLRDAIRTPKAVT